MVPADQIKIETDSEVFYGGFGDVRAGRLEGHTEKMAVKELRAAGDVDKRSRTQVVSRWSVLSIIVLLITNSISVKAFARELKVWENLSHPNLLPLVAFHWESSQGIFQFVSPYADGGNLSTYLRLGGADADMPTRLRLVRPTSFRLEAIAYRAPSQSLDTAEGLSYLHERKIIHGALKGVRPHTTPTIFVTED